MVIRGWYSFGNQVSGMNQSKIDDEFPYKGISLYGIDYFLIRQVIESKLRAGISKALMEDSIAEDQAPLTV